MLYWRVTLNGKTVRHPIGLYDSSAPPKSIIRTSKGFSIAAATREAEELSQKHEVHKDKGGLVAFKAAERISLQDAADAELRAREFTLQKLLDSYCDFQQKRGRSSYKDARSIFERHIKDPYPQVMSQPANTVTMEQFVEMMRRLQTMGRGRTSNKLRSYVRAAYEIARHAKANPATPLIFLKFSISHNPLVETVVDASSNKADKNPLKLEQMRIYWNSIKDLKGRPGSVLRLHLLTGAQRIEQFVRLQTSEIHDQVIILWDGKGKPGQPPRENPIPLIPAAKIALAECTPTGKFALSTKDGGTHVHATTLSKWAQAAVGELIPNFQAKQLRSGVETLLSSARISKDVRGRLQSHGISGVQDKNYDGYDYIDQKREALEILFARLNDSHQPLPASSK